MTRLLRLVSILWLCTHWPVAAQDPLARVRELYVSADYEAALKALDGLVADAGGQTLDIDRYRALCLIGLGQSAAAEQVIERIVTNAPLYQPGVGDSPAVRAAFNGVRRRVLPSLAHKLFSDAKVAYDRNALAEAAAKFRYTQEVLDSLDPSDQPDLINLRTLTAGFWELTRDSLPPTAVPSPDPAAAPAAEPAPAVPEAGARESDPKPIRQEMPRWTFAIAAAHYDAHFRATVELDIDELGNVTGVQIVQSSHPGYNRVLLEAARGWKYSPALRDNEPVKTRKRVDVELRPK
jgi:TonB family protein